MAAIKKNIWLLFYTIIFIGTITITSIIFYLINGITNNYQTEQENITKMTANSFNSVFNQHEMILNILGSHILEEKNKDHDIKKLFENLIKNNPSIIILELIDKNGNTYISTSNKMEKKQIILKEKREKEYLNYILESKVFTIGRTYFDKKLNKLIIPIGKAVINSKGETVAIISAGIDIHKGFDFFINNSKVDTKYETFLFREHDNYFQIAQRENFDNPNIYNYQIPKDLIQYGIDITERNYKKSIYEIKRDELIVTIRSNDKRDVFHSSVFLNKYQLWVTTQLPFKIIQKEIISKSLLLIIIFITLNIILYYLFNLINESEMKKQKALLYQAHHDYLTNLHNRQFLSSTFEDEKNIKPYTLFFIDMDNFKNINDNYGHELGDKILKEISKRLSEFKKDNELLIRYSGDEFILIINLKEKHIIKKLARRIIKSLAKPYNIEPYQFILGASIGISRYPEDGNNIDEIKRYADIAMYEAKKEKNTFKLFESNLKNAYLRNSIIEYELKNSLNNNEIYMMYQPQISASGLLYGVEALVRWENKKLGFVPPDEFINIAENSGFMQKLGAFIIENSIKEIKQLQIELNINMQLSINISVKQFMDPKFYNDLFNVVQKYNFDKLQLTLEITENIFIEDKNFIIDLLNKLREEKIKISLDDFGTGYSSLSLLKKLPIDELKIDKSFIDDILNDENSESMVESIISIGKKFNLLIVAEGIEEKEQKERLNSFNCDLYQGYYYSKPLKKDDLKTYIENNHA